MSRVAIKASQILFTLKLLISFSRPIFILTTFSSERFNDCLLMEMIWFGSSVCNLLTQPFVEKCRVSNINQTLHETNKKFWCRDFKYAWLSTLPRCLMPSNCIKLIIILSRLTPRNNRHHATININVFHYHASLKKAKRVLNCKLVLLHDWDYLMVFRAPMSLYY